MLLSPCVSLSLFLPPIRTLHVCIDIVGHWPWCWIRTSHDYHWLASENWKCALHFVIKGTSTKCEAESGQKKIQRNLTNKMWNTYYSVTQHRVVKYGQSIAIAIPSGELRRFDHFYNKHFRNMRFEHETLDGSSLVAAENGAISGIPMSSTFAVAVLLRKMSFRFHGASEAAVCFINASVDDNECSLPFVVCVSSAVLTYVHPIITVSEATKWRGMCQRQNFGDEQH